MRDSGYREACRGIVVGLLDDPKGCEGLAAEAARDRCFHERAVRSGDVTKCGLMVDPLERTECVMVVASATGDEAACDFVEEGERRQCKASIAEAVRSRR